MLARLVARFVLHVQFEMEVLQNGGEVVCVVAEAERSDAPAFGFSSASA